jgi:putative ATPase
MSTYDSLGVSLFESNGQIDASLFSAPLAERMRPKRFEDFFGQKELLEKTVFLKQIEQDQIRSMILWGPPGTGKTTLAKIIAERTDKNFISLSAVESGIKDIKETVQKARFSFERYKKKTLLFIDEIHRFNKSQQDALLPHVESGLLTLIGATTENPSFELNSALLSRAAVFVLKPHTEEDLFQIINKALHDLERGVSPRPSYMNQDWIRGITSLAQGDARKALGILEQVCYYLSLQKEEVYKELSWNELAEKAVSIQVPRYDKSGEAHYDFISAFIKSMRDSDVQAALYYLARMISGGEDPFFILRRMAVFASEDIGNADPRALQMVMSCKEAVHFVGMPEGRINLSQVVIYLSLAPKSNSAYEAITEALKTAKETESLAIPMHLRNAPTSLMKSLGYAQNYQYAHLYRDGMTEMQNLPKEIEGRKFYKPKESGFEKQLKEKLSWIVEKKNKL